MEPADPFDHQPPVRLCCRRCEPLVGKAPMQATILASGVRCGICRHPFSVGTTALVAWAETNRHH